jgi:hypothetical protein
MMIEGGRKMKTKTTILLQVMVTGLLLAVFGGVVLAEEVSVPNSFTAGTTARALEVNQNFQALVNEINALLARVAALEAKLEAVTDNGTDLVITDRNVHIRSGSGATDGAVNGMGNLIIGYNEDNGDTRTGSHNLVIGPNHTYTSFGGLVAGLNNNITGTYSSVSGGYLNTASGSYSSVSGGANNTASGNVSSVRGGENNTAPNRYSSVSGGGSNTASGWYSSVSGGSTNTASGNVSSILGGYQKTVTTIYGTSYAQ